MLISESDSQTPRKPTQVVVLPRDKPWRWSVLWERSSSDEPPQPVDLREWTGVLSLESFRGDLSLTVPATLTADGEVFATVEASRVHESEWADEPWGLWAIVLTSPAGLVEHMADGYFEMER